MNDPSARPLAGDSGRDRILDAAALLFRNRGYSGTSLRDIANAAGMKAGSIYYHFPSKNEIVAAVLDAGVEHVHRSVQTALQRLPENVTHRDRITAAMIAHLKAFLGRSDYTSANLRIFGQVPPEIRERNMPAREAYEDVWRAMLKEARDQGELRDDVDLTSLRLFMIGGMNSALEWYRPERSEKIEKLAKKFAAIMFDGVARAPTGGERD